MATVFASLCLLIVTLTEGCPFRRVYILVSGWASRTSATCARLTTWPSYTPTGIRRISDTSLNQPRLRMVYSVSPWRAMPAGTLTFS